MAEAKKHTGGCHCGKVRFEATVDLGRVVSCNCSICASKGLLLTFIGADQFKLLSGQDDLTTYQFNKKAIDHLFCRSCGVQPFARGTTPDGQQAVTVNVRCLDGIDLAQINPMPFDGRSL